MRKSRFLSVLGGGMAFALVVALATPASATVSYGDTNVSCTNTAWTTSKFDSYWHRTAGPTSFWNDGSSHRVDVKTVNGTRVLYAYDLDTGDYKAWTTAESAVGFWSLYNKPDAAFACTTFHLDYSYVHKPW